jgi:hypothetical protein
MLDAIDAAIAEGTITSQWPPGGGSQAIPIPMATEAAYRYGVLRSAAMVTPATIAVAAVRATRDRQFNLSDVLLWPALQIAVGKLFSLTEKAQIRRRSEREEQRRKAAGEQAVLGGKRAWIAANLHLLDRLENFGLNIRHVPGVQLASARELDELAKTVRQLPLPEPGQRAYLAALLHRYEDDQSTTHRLEDRLTVVGPPGADGQLLLTEHQTRVLWDALTLVGVAGRMRIRVSDKISRGLDTELVLEITSTRTLNDGPPARLTLRLPTGLPAWRVEFVTVGLGLAGVHIPILCLPGGGMTIPWRTGLMAMALDGLGAAVAEGCVRRFGSQAAPGAAVSAIVPALFIARYGAKDMEFDRSADGINFYPGTWAFTGISYLLGFYATRMKGALRLALMGGVGTLIATTWLSSRKPRNLSTFAAELIWSAAAMIGGGRLAVVLAKLSARVAADHEKETREHAADQWMTGWMVQHHEAELIQDKARQTIEQARPETPPHNADVEYARQEFSRLADELAAVATPPSDE